MKSIFANQYLFFVLSVSCFFFWKNLPYFFAKKKSHPFFITFCFCSSRFVFTSVLRIRFCLIFLFSWSPSSWTHFSFTSLPSVFSLDNNYPLLVFQENFSKISFLHALVTSFFHQIFLSSFFTPLLFYLLFSWSPSSWAQFVSLHFLYFFEQQFPFSFVSKKLFSLSLLHACVTSSCPPCAHTFVHLLSLLSLSRFYHICFSVPSFVFSVHNLFLKKKFMEILQI